MGLGESRQIHQRAAENIQLPGKERESPGMDDASIAGGFGARESASAGPTAVRSAAARHRAAEATVVTARATARATANEGQQ